MKVKTWTDTRIFEEQAGCTIAELEAVTQTGYKRLTPEEEANFAKRKKPEPEHHKYDIEALSGVSIKESLVVRLFYLYGQFKSYKERFSLSDFCKHHEITRQDIARLKQISFEIGYKAGFNEGMQVDKYRSEIFEQMELYLQNKQKKEPKTTSLEAMFSEKKHLDKLVEELTAKGFCHLENGTLKWTGIKHEARGKGLQLVALAYLCQPYYKRKDNGKEYQQTELHEAWTTFFNYKLAVNNFSEAMRPPPDSIYDHLFQPLIKALRFI